MLIFIFPIIAIFAFSILYALYPDIYLQLIQEDSVIEYGQAGLFLLASIVGFISTAKLRKLTNKFIFWVILLFSLGCFIIFAEEISWGQRIFSVQTPASLSWRSTQNEINFHNTRAVQDHIRLFYFIACSYAATAWIFIRHSNLGALDVRRFIIPQWNAIFYFVPIAVFYYWHDYVREPNAMYILWPQVAAWRHQEFFEILFALGCFIVAITNHRKVQNLLIKPAT